MDNVGCVILKDFQGNSLEYGWEGSEHGRDVKTNYSQHRYKAENSAGPLIEMPEQSV